MFYVLKRFVESKINRYLKNGESVNISWYYDTIYLIDKTGTIINSWLFIEYEEWWNNYYANV